MENQKTVHFEGEATNKIDTTKGSKYHFILIDKLTDSLIGVYNSNQQATNVAIELIKKDLDSLIQYYRTQVLLGFEDDSKVENKNLLAQLKQYIYQRKTISLSNQLHMTIGDKNVLRYIIRTTITNDKNLEIDESNFNLI